MRMMNIRRAAMHDASVIADFNVRLALESEDLKLEPKTVLRGVQAMLEDPAKGIYFVAEDGGQLMGQLMITYEWSDWRNGNMWWIQSVFVKPEFRGRGVFKALFDHVERLARKNPEVYALRLYMDDRNEPARRAYEKIGMTQTHYVVFDKTLGADSDGRG
jgi:GNAT superfamily N-acetyltransferase